MWSLTIKVKISKKLLAVRGDFDRDNTRRSRIFEDCTLLPEDFPPGYMNLPMRSPGTVRRPMRSWRRFVPICWVTAIPPQLRFWRKDVILPTVSFLTPNPDTVPPLPLPWRCWGAAGASPPRYVEGFATDQTCSVEDTEIHLGGSSAHAWAEAYLEPCGLDSL